MRVLVILVAALAGLKVWTQDRLYRSIMQDALVEAYRDRATASCLKAFARSGVAVSSQWPVKATAEVMIGNPATDVAMWDYQNPLWDVRFRHPHVKLSAADAGPDCAFDVAAGLATTKVN
jgi:hypothetical protein